MVTNVYGLISRVKEHIGIASLEAHNRIYNSNIDKANIFNNYFSTVFTKEDTIDLPNLDDGIYPTTDSLHVYMSLLMVFFIYCMI